MFLRTLAALAVFALVNAGSAFAENRIALVIGNSSYRSVTVLPNPANDAKAVTDMLSSAGFEIVSAPDLTQSDMRRTVRDFAAKVTQLGPDTVALVYYAGHGLQVDGENYLVPVDANIESEADVAIEAVRLADIMNALAATPSHIKIAILDACRNNPFSKINKTTGRGLAIVDAPNGSIVSYSTSPGAEALDGDAGNSPFTASLVNVVREPGLPIEQAFKRIRLEVHNKTQGQQTPWESSSLTDNFSFFGKDGSVPQGSAEKSTSAVASAKDQPAASRDAGATSVRRKPVSYWRDMFLKKSADEAFEIVIREDDVDAYEQFLLLYPTQSFATRVRSLLDRRREMMTWYTVVTVNTVTAYEAFLKRYPDSDLMPTAKRMLERAKLMNASANLMPNLPGLTPVSAPAMSLPATPVSAPAMCPCQQNNNKKPERKTEKPEKEKPGKPTRTRQASGPVDDDDGPPIVVNPGFPRGPRWGVHQPWNPGRTGSRPMTTNKGMTIQTMPRRGY